MFCRECGEDNRNDRKFCTNCGAPLQDYTKEKPELLMPEDIEKKQEFVYMKTKVYKILNMILWPLVAVSAVLTTISFWLDDNAKFATIVIALVLIAGCFGLILAKRTLRKNAKNLNNEEKNKQDQDSNNEIEE